MSKTQETQKQDSRPRKEDGRIDWKHLINPRHIVFNPNPKLEELFVERYGDKAANLVYAEVAKDHEVPDEHILVKLNGFIELAELRGYKSVNQHIDHVTPGENVTATCHITWLSNEEENYEKTSAATADATMENTGGFGYLAAMAGNRAFVRAVKNGLGIFILGFDEIAKKDAPLPEVGPAAPAAYSPQDTLQKAAASLKTPLTFEQIKKGASLKYKDKLTSDPDTWTGYADVPPKDCMALIGLLKKAQAA